MSSALTTYFATQYDGKGADQAKAGIVGVQQSLKGISAEASGVGTNYEGLMNKMERPLGRVAFHGLAADILASNSAMTSAGGATGMLAQGLHAVGNAAMFAGGEFAVFAIAGVAVYELYEHLVNKSKDLEKAAQDSAKSSADEAVAYNQVAEQLMNMDPKYKDIAERLKNQEKGSRAAAIEILNKAMAEERETAAAETASKTTKDYNDKMAAENERLAQLSNSYEGHLAAQRKFVENTNQQSEAVENLRKKEDNLKIILNNVKSLTDLDAQKKSKPNTAEENQANAIIEKRNLSMKTSVELTKDMAIEQERLEAAINQYIKTTGPVEKQYYAQKIVGLSNVLAKEKATLQEEKNLAKQKEDMYKKEAAISNKYLDAAASAVEMHGKKIVFNGKKFLGQEIADAADQAAMYLQIQAFKYFGAGNYAMGIAAMAGAVAVKGVGAIAAAEFGSSSGGDTGTSASSAPSSSPATTSDSLSSESAASNVRPMNLSIQVNALHAGTAQELGVQLCKLINQAVDISGAQLKATTVQAGGNWVAV
jgi:hypothetical protein